MLRMKKMIPTTRHIPPSTFVPEEPCLIPYHPSPIAMHEKMTPKKNQATTRQTKPPITANSAVFSFSAFCLAASASPVRSLPQWGHATYSSFRTLPQEGQILATSVSVSFFDILVSSPVHCTCLRNIFFVHRSH